MGRRSFKKPRCRGCGLWEELCLCRDMPHVSLATRFVFVQHNRERLKPTGTARIAHRMLEGSALVHYGARGEAMDTGPLADSGFDYRLLFPREDAVELAPATSSPALVVLDGTWHQCSRMSRRAPRVRELPCVRLPEGPPSRWGVREAHDPHLLCTLEAVIRAVALLEGEDAAAPLERFFERLRVAMMAMKGKPPAGESRLRWE